LYFERINTIVPLTYLANLYHKLTLLSLRNRKLRDFNRFANDLYKANYNLNHQSGKSGTLIVMIDEHTPKGGLVDKLKGIVSGYLLAELLQYQFYVYIKVDNFPLYDFIRERFPVYLQSGTNEAVSFNKKQARPVMIYNHLPLSFRWTVWRLRQISQIHLYCNLDLTCLIKKSTKTEAIRIWGQSFNKLFYFDTAIVNAFPAIPLNVKRIGVHLRFMSLLGDFQDSGVDPHLLPDQQVALIDLCKGRLKQLLTNDVSNSVFFLFTDSVRFIDSVLGDAEIAGMNRTFIADKKNIAHTGLMSEVSVLERAVRDFYFLSRCDKVYLIKGPGMHNSDFSRYSCYLQNTEFSIIHLDNNL